jgi:hypothetical protein
MWLGDLTPLEAAAVFGLDGVVIAAHSRTARAGQLPRLPAGRGLVHCALQPGEWKAWHPSV